MKKFKASQTFDFLAAIGLLMVVAIAAILMIASFFPTEVQAQKGSHRPLQSSDPAVSAPDFDWNIDQDTTALSSTRRLLDSMDTAGRYQDRIESEVNQVIDEWGNEWESIQLPTGFMYNLRGGLYMFSESHGSRVWRSRSLLVLTFVAIKVGIEREGYCPDMSRYDFMLIKKK